MGKLREISEEWVRFLTEGEWTRSITVMYQGEVGPA